ncbi:unnamed protein product [Effrenium voratum]|uniref:Acyl-coenzyme A thioesterase THEM4 n=1 Tax=Effrenium voratum TaxID=2562239 RepID=A0AA36N502_9DINO|nr:unnamed protein product [Effrenium voratum]
MCERALDGLQRLLGQCLGKEEEDEAPEVYSARYVPLRRALPETLRRACLQASPTVHLRAEQAFRRSKRKFPQHLLHATLQSAGLGEATYYFEVNCESVVQKSFVHWRLGSLLEGPPGHCHGGCVAALMDDAFGSFTNTYLRSSGSSGEAVTAYLKVDYKAPTPLPSDVVCVVELERSEGRKIFLSGYMLVDKGSFQKSCEATALFVELKAGYAALAPK